MPKPTGPTKVWRTIGLARKLVCLPVLERRNCMIDSQGRNINKLRISLTEVCNMACTYCVTSLSDHKRMADELKAEEMLVLVEMLKKYAGIEKVRLTGGEPLLYRNLIKIISGIREMGITSIGVTTNGQLLAKKAKALAESGVIGVNLSLDTLDPEKFRRMGRTGRLHKTLDGIEASLKYGLKVKVNMVVMKGENDDEIIKMLEYGVLHGIEIRFLELMSMGPLHKNVDTKLVSMENIIKKISSKYGVKLVSAEADSTSIRYSVPGGNFGIIPNNSAPFCSSCSRLRLTSNGHLIGCLSNPKSISVRDLLDDNRPAEELKKLVKKSISYKQDVAFTGSSLVMSRIGG